MGTQAFSFAVLSENPEIAAFLSLCFLPHGIKLVNGPIMDRWTHWPMGRRRPWVLFAQLCLLLTFVSLALIPDPLNNMGLLAAAGFVINFCSAFQDVATDGMAVDVLPTEDQPKASGLMFGGQTVSIAAFAAAGGWALPKFGLAATSLCCAACVGLIFLVPLISLERPGERLLPWTSGRATVREGMSLSPTFREIAAGLKTFFLLPASLLFVATYLLFSTGRGIHITLLPIFYVQELGWTDTELSNLSGTALLIGGAFSVLLGGFVVELVGRIRVFSILCGLMVLFGLVLATVPSVWESTQLMYAYRVAYQLLETLAVVAMISIALALCAKRIAATQFAIYMAMSNLGFTFGSKVYGEIQEQLSHAAVLVVFATVTAGAMLLIWTIKIGAHKARVEELQGG
jgi:PAT family beta-lactamase induction signal transducer AmpG